jgi:hypothetical protein
MPRSDSLRSSIESLLADFAAQFELLVRQSAVERVMAALESEGAPSRGRPGRPPGSRNKLARGGRRASGDMDAMQEQLLSHVKANPGQRSDQIATALGSDVKTIRLPMQKLIAARQVKTQGQRRGMTYSAGAGGPARPAKRGRRGKRKSKR